MTRDTWLTFLSSKSPSHSPLAPICFFYGRPQTVVSTKHTCNSELSEVNKVDQCALPTRQNTVLICHTRILATHPYPCVPCPSTAKCPAGNLAGNYGSIFTHSLQGPQIIEKSQYCRYMREWVLSAGCIQAY